MVLRICFTIPYFSNIVGNDSKEIDVFFKKVQSTNVFLMEIIYTHQNCSISDLFCWSIYAGLCLSSISSDVFM